MEYINFIMYFILTVAAIGFTGCIGLFIYITVKLLQEG